MELEKFMGSSGTNRNYASKYGLFERSVKKGKHHSANITESLK
jgi:hypothetical protein